ECKRIAYWNNVRQRVWLLPNRNSGAPVSQHAAIARVTCTPYRRVLWRIHDVLNFQRGNAGVDRGRRIRARDKLRCVERRLMPDRYPCWHDGDAVVRGGDQWPVIHPAGRISFMKTKMQPSLSR